MTSLAGEYRLVGREGKATGQVFQQFGSGAKSALQVLGGGRQEYEFVDGLRMSVLSDANMTMNVDIFSQIPTNMIPKGFRSLCKSP